MMCEDINKLLAAYLDGEVTPEEQSQIETHLSSCGKCREELRLLDTTREGLRQALKMRAAGVEPSPRAWDAVSQRITSSSSFWERFSSIFERLVWRAAIPVAILLVLAAGVLWRTGILPLPGNKSLAPAETAMAPDRATTPAPTTVPTAPAAPESKALEPPVIFFPAPTTPPPTIVGAAPPAVTVQQPPPAEGWLEKTVLPNQSQTVNGITFVLVRVEMTAAGMKVYAFNTPPGYNLPQGPMLPPSQFMIYAEAEYSIDGGVVKKAPLYSIGFLENGMVHLWENLDPVPKTAKELTFRITKLGEWTGPWVFKISLQ